MNTIKILAIALAVTFSSAVYAGEWEQEPAGETVAYQTGIVPVSCDGETYYGYSHSELISMGSPCQGTTSPETTGEHYELISTGSTKENGNSDSMGWTLPELHSIGAPN